MRPFRLPSPDIIKLVAASSSPSAPTFGSGSVFHTPSGGLHVSAFPPLAFAVAGALLSSQTHQSALTFRSAASPLSPNLGPTTNSAAVLNHVSVAKPAPYVPATAALQPVALTSMRSPEGKPPRPPAPSTSTAPALAAAASASASLDVSAVSSHSSGKGRSTPPPPSLAAASGTVMPAPTSAPSVEPEREELQVNQNFATQHAMRSGLLTFPQLSEDESEFPATSPENSRSVSRIVVCAAAYSCSAKRSGHLCRTQLPMAAPRASASENPKKQPLKRVSPR